MKFGAHVSVRGGVGYAPDRAAEIGCETFQIFTRNQRQWRAKPLDQENIEAFIRKASAYAPLCAHASYLINLAASNQETLQKSRESMVDEIRRANQLGIQYVVVHSGAHMGLGRERGLKTLIESLEVVFEATRQQESTTLLLENSAGAGTTLAADLSDLSHVQEAMKHHPRLGFCLDTCHLFASGHHFARYDQYQTLRDYIDRTLGIENIPVLHFNDSKKPFASRVDQHEKIGFGRIGVEPFSFWINDPAWHDKIAILETPGGEENYKREIALLKSIRDGA